MAMVNRISGRTCISCWHDGPIHGFVAERLIAPVLKTDEGKPSVSSNLTKPATLLKERWLSDGQHLPAKKASGDSYRSLVRIQHVPPTFTRLLEAKWIGSGVLGRE